MGIRTPSHLMACMFCESSSQALVPILEDLHEELPVIASTGELRNGNVGLDLLNSLLNQALEI